MNRRILLGIAGWLTVAVAATTAGVAAIDVLEEGITGQNVRALDDEAVHRALARSGVKAAHPTLTVSPSPSPTDGVLRNLGTQGGTVTARCLDGQVTILAATPAQGFHTGDIEHGPATSATLTFESDSTEYVATVTCVNGSPSVRSTEDDGHHGRHRGRG
jgi:hypothetical protein